MNKIPLQTVSGWDNRGVHNFSLGCLCSYFLLDDKLATGDAFLIGDGALHISTPKPKTFIFALSDDMLSKVKDLQHRGPVYSICPIPLEKGGMFKEIVYDLDEVFNEASYKNTDKRKKALRAPFKKLKDWGVTSEPLTEKNIKEVERLHHDWCEYKLGLPTTFRMGFSTARYIRCCRKALESWGSSTSKKQNTFRKIVYPFQFFPSYKARVYLLDKTIGAVLVSSIQGATAYSLAGFSSTWSAPSQFTHHVTIDFMKYLWEEGIKTVNDGSSGNKQLKTYKCHYPHRVLTSYVYSKIKE